MVILSEAGELIDIGRPYVVSLGRLLFFRDPFFHRRVVECVVCGMVRDYGMVVVVGIILVPHHTPYTLVTMHFLSSNRRLEHHSQEGECFVGCEHP